jgi:DNA-binding transcriptional LysR family regulator
VQEALDSQMDERLKNGNFDLAIRYINQQHLQESDAILLMANSFLVGPKKDQVTQAKAINFVDLAPLRLILPCRPSQWRNHLDDVALKKGFKLQVIEQADSLALQKAIVQNSSHQGEAVHTILGPLAIQDELTAGSLQASPIGDPELTRAVAITGNPKQQPTHAKELILELIKAQAKNIFDPQKFN